MYQIHNYILVNEIDRKPLKHVYFRLTVKRFINNQYYLYLVALVLYEYVSLCGTL